MILLLPSSPRAPARVASFAALTAVVLGLSGCASSLAGPVWTPPSAPWAEPPPALPGLDFFASNPVSLDTRQSTVAPLGPADPSVEAKGGVGLLRLQVQVSRQRFNALSGQHGGRYLYAAGFRSWVGFGHERQVTVNGARVVEHAYRAFDRGGKTTEEWVEQGASVGAHNGGKPPATLDQLYAECLGEVLTKSPADHEFYVAFFRDGVLAHCTARHRQCADDCSRGVRLHSVRWR